MGPGATEGKPSPRRTSTATPPRIARTHIPGRQQRSGPAGKSAPSRGGCNTTSAGRDVPVVIKPVLAAASLVLVLAGCGTNTSSTSSTSSTAPTSSTAASPAPATGTASAAPLQRASDPRCTPASAELVNQVAGGMKNRNLGLTNGTVIADGALQFFGATTVRPDGKFENRSDVWIVQNGTIYSSTGGARNTTTFPNASDTLKISAGDARIQAVDLCVVNLTR